MRNKKKIWVTCPNCGSKKTKVRYGELDFECKCGIAFTANIEGGIQITVINDGENNTQQDYNFLIEHLNKYRRRQQLLAL